MTTPTVDQLSDTLHDKAKIHATMLHAEYWRDAAKIATDREQQWIRHDCAVNSWKNLAVSLSEELKLANARIAALSKADLKS